MRQSARRSQLIRLVCCRAGSLIRRVDEVSVTKPSGDCQRLTVLNDCLALDDRIRSLILCVCVWGGGEELLLYRCRCRRETRLVSRE